MREVMLGEEVRAEGEAGGDAAWEAGGVVEPVEVASLVEEGREPGVM